jgi:SAM-dependent methyltransferase
MDAESWDERYAAAELVWSREPNRFVAAECADLPPGTAVDLAAGEGRNAIWLASRGWTAYAVDFSQVALDKGRELAGDLDVTWVCADATSWQPPEPVDLVVVAYLQLPAAERRAAVRGAATMLRPGGTLLLVAHDSTNLTEGTGGPQDPAVLMTAEDVLGDLDGIDVEVVRAGRVAREVGPASGQSHHEHAGEERRTAWDCLVRVVRR